MPRLDARTIPEIDVEKDVNSVAEIVLVCESRRRRKQQAGVAVLPQQPRHALQHRGVVIDDHHKGLICDEYRLRFGSDTRERNSLSVIDGCRRRGGDPDIIEPYVRFPNKEVSDRLYWGWRRDFREKRALFIGCRTFYRPSEMPRKTPTRSARDTSSATDRTCIFSITVWRWALMVRSVPPSARATALLVLPRTISSKTSR